MLQNKKKLMALVCGTLKYNYVLQHMLTASNLTSLEKSLTDEHLTKILLYEAFFGKGLRGNGEEEVSTVVIIFLTS